MLLLQLGGLVGTFNEINLGLKLVLLLMIIGFVRSHVQSTVLSTVLIGMLAYLILIQNWAWLGPFYVLYMMVTFGVTQIFVDYAFSGGMFGGGEQPQAAEGTSPPSKAPLMMRRRGGFHG